MESEGIGRREAKKSDVSRSWALQRETLPGTTRKASWPGITY